MVERSEQFPHIQLRLASVGIAATPPSGGRKQNPRTTANASDRWGHGSRLKSLALSIVSDWKDTQAKRKDEEKPPLPEKRARIILQIDPDSFDPDGLKAYGIEVIAELEDGYIIGASADLELSALQKKIGKFINEEWGGGKVAEIWELIDGRKRPEYILSPELLAHWSQVNDEQIYTVEVGVACVGTQSKLPNPPKPKAGESEANFQEKLRNWWDKRQLTEQDWESIAWERQEQFEEFIGFCFYQGRITEGFRDEGGSLGTAQLPDSFSCRIQISGKGLKDLVFNFPYIFEVSEPDQFAELLQRQGLSDDEESTFTLEPPPSNAPKVCVIDSGIQERHSLLKAAINSNHSRS